MKIGFPSPEGNLTPRQARMWKVLLFLARVAALSLPLYLIIWLGLDLMPLQLAAASQSAWLLGALGYQAVQEGVGITMGNGFAFFIIPDCTGWKSMLFLFALVFAVPGTALRKRLWGLAAGLPLIWLGNLLRIVGVVWAQSIWGTEAALSLHDTLYQAGLVAMVLAIWFTWLLWEKGRISLPGAFSRLR
jgi:exosortase/archaeosortase family protein